MTQKLKRYDPARRGFNQVPMDEDVDGEYVKYEDYEKLQAQLERAEAALIFYSIPENWETSAIDDLCSVKTKLTKDKESFGEVDAPGLASKLVIYGGKRAREYFKEKEQV